MTHVGHTHTHHIQIQCIGKQKRKIITYAWLSSGSAIQLQPFKITFNIKNCYFDLSSPGIVTFFGRKLPKSVKKGQRTRWPKAVGSEAKQYANKMDGIKLREFFPQTFASTLTYCTWCHEHRSLKMMHFERNHRIISFLHQVV